MSPTQPQSHIYRIKEGKLQAWTDWCSKIHGELRAKGIETLKEEGITYEFFILFKIDDDYYTHGVSITGDGEKPGKANMSDPVNQEHFRIMRECLELVDTGKPLYFLQVEQAARA